MKRATRTRLRKQISNTEYPTLLLRFEDGHEIRVKRGSTKSFDAWSGESIRVVAVYDPTGGERELIATRRADDFDDGD